MTIAKTKQAMIRRYGQTVTFLNRATPIPTKAIIGTSVRKTSIRLGDIENFLRGNFVPNDFISNGEVIMHGVTGIRYMILGVYKETVGDEYLCDVCNLLKVNSSYTLTKLIEDADDYGNITTKEVNVIEDAPSYVEPIYDDMRESDIGIVENATYRLYTSIGSAVQLYDQIKLETDGYVRDMRVEAINFIALQGVYMLQLSSDIRGI